MSRSKSPRIHINAFRLAQGAIPLFFLAGALIAFRPCYACGPFAPTYLLGDRNSTLLDMPNGSFTFEAQHLVARNPKLPVWRAPAVSHNGDTDRKKRVAEIAAKLQTALPPAERYYYLGARDFYNGSGQTQSGFTQLLALPKAAQGEWRLKALYSLARQNYDVHEGEDSIASIYHSFGYDADAATEGIRRYQQVIDEVLAGEPDPERLSLASLGQLGFYQLNSGNMSGAIKLYAQQAAQGVPGGEVSLRRISLFLTNEENFPLLEKLIDDPMVQQLVIAELFIRRDWGYDEQGCIDSNSEYSCATHRDKIINLLIAHRTKGFAYSDRLAALAYRNGDYTLSKLLLADAPESGLGEWLHAKLALREGGIPLATRYYARAAKYFPDEETPGNPQTQSNAYRDDQVKVTSCRIASEHAILALKRDDYQQAMALLYQGKDIYWADLADVAESVLTLQELKAFVDKNVPAPAHPLVLEDYPDNYDGFVSPAVIPADVKLRALLARRLVRNGQYQQAVAYFDIPDYRRAAQNLADLKSKARQKNISKRERAQAQYEAAQLLRNYGIELAAYEMYPDYAITSGQYSTLYDVSYEGNWFGKYESPRFNNAIPAKNLHFLHYRWRAAEWAERSADLLHPKTQAWAAVLCNAANWVGARDPKASRALYLRYVKNGKSFAWASHFGRDCPQPEFNNGK